MEGNDEKKEKNIINKNDLLKELIQKQRPDCCKEKKLALSDMKRIVRNVNTSILGTECCFWNGYVTNKNNQNRPKYITFYFRNKKVSLHRLLYCNFRDSLLQNKYLKYICNNKGICCNVNHLKKVGKNVSKKYIKKNKKLKCPNENIKNPNVSESKVDNLVVFD